MLASSATSIPLNRPGKSGWDDEIGRYVEENHLDAKLANANRRG